MYILSINKKLKCQKGFSLIEIMVVCAIIGILVSIALPNYQRYQRKSQQSGAKIELSGMFTAERTFISAWGFGSSCMKQIGYKPTGDSLYNVGWSPTSNTGNFNASNSTPPTSYQGPECASSAKYSSQQDNSGTLADVKNGIKTHINISNNSKTFGGNPGSCSGGGSCSGHTNKTACTGGCTWTSAKNALHIPGEGANDRLYKITFTVGAVGFIGGQVEDSWTMTHQKLLRNTQSGL